MKAERFMLLAALGGGALTARLLRARHHSFRGKVVLIAGGSRGLGLVLARECARLGARVALCARDAVELVHARDELSASGAAVTAHVADVRDHGQVDGMVRDVLAAHGRIDVLVNCAGVIEMGPLEHMAVADFRDAMEVHFWGALHAILSVLPSMRAQGGGRIVNIASIGGKVAVPHLAPYCASKFALVGLSQALRVELARDGILVTTVCPGLMRTGSADHARFKGRHRAEHALFRIAAGAPLLALDARRAARQILAAAGRGDPELVLTVPAKVAATLQTLSPSLMDQALRLLDRALPGPGGIRGHVATGRASASILAPSMLTRPNDRAAARNNELPAPL